MIQIRLKAMRAGVWFRRLPRIDRALIDLAIKVAKFKIHGAPLIDRLITVTSKLENFLESKLSLMTRQIGLPLANKLSCLAQKWGNISAKNWQNDLEFARYLAVTKLNAN